MSLKQYLQLIGAGTGLSWLGWLIVISFINIQEAFWPAIILFYLSLSLAIFGSLTLLSFIWRYRTQEQELWFRHLNISFRQSLIVVLMIDIALILQSFRYLSWWMILILLAVAACAELLWASFRR